MLLLLCIGNVMNYGRGTGESGRIVKSWRNLDSMWLSHLKHKSCLRPTAPCLFSKNQIRTLPSHGSSGDREYQFLPCCTAGVVATGVWSENGSAPTNVLPRKTQTTPKRFLQR